MRLWNTNLASRLAQASPWSRQALLAGQGAPLNLTSGGKICYILSIFGRLSEIRKGLEHNPIAVYPLLDYVILTRDFEEKYVILSGLKFFHFYIGINPY
jgi:hypothetical protein